MRIRRITLIPLRIPLIEPFIISLGPLTHAENVVVKIETHDGIIGWGECSPFRTIHGETIGTCMSVGRELAEQLLEMDTDHPEMWLRRMDRLIYGNSSIKSAMDIALHDILSQRVGLPLYRFLGGEKIRPLMTDYTVSLSDRTKMVHDAELIVEKGFKVIKVKLGGDPLEDIERVRSIRKAIGPEIPLRLDANQGWTKEGAMLALPQLENMNVQYCEEPLPRWQFLDLKAVQESTNISILADESCCTDHDAERLISLGACRGVNIKLGKSAGLVRAQQVARQAKEAGWIIQVGGFLESRLGFTAAAHFTMAYPDIDLVDFDTPLMFTEDPIAGGMTYGKGGVITLHDVPGLGASLKPEMINTREKVVVER